MKLEIEGTKEEVMAIMAVFGQGLAGRGTCHAQVEVVTVAGPMAPEGAEVSKSEPEAKPAVAPVAEPDKRFDDRKPEGEEQPKATSKRAPRKTVEQTAAPELPAGDKPLTAEPEKTKEPVADTKPAETKPIEPEKTKEPVAEPKADAKPVTDAKPVVLEGITLPQGWETWSVTKRRQWAQTSEGLTPSQRFRLLQANPVEPRDDSKSGQSADEGVTGITPPQDPPKAEGATQPEATGAATKPAASGPLVLPAWDKWSLAKRIVWVTSLNAADTDQIVALLEFRKEVGEVTEDNLQIARRKLQIAMRLRDQVENGGKGKDNA